MGGRQFKPKPNPSKHPLYLIHVERKPQLPRTCPNCGHEFQKGESGHMVPPGFGDRAMFTCDGKLKAGEQVPE